MLHKRDRHTLEFRSFRQVDGGPHLDFEMWATSKLIPEMWRGFRANRLADTRQGTTSQAAEKGLSKLQSLKEHSSGAKALLIL